MRILLVLSYIVSCCRLGVGPWRYFQLNADYFNDSKGIFSKLDIDNLIPAKWRLLQRVDNHSIRPANYPVFLKPEWGQNSKGILRADNETELNTIRTFRNGSSIQHLIQEAAGGHIEFEVFVIPKDSNLASYAVLSVTKVVNHSNDIFPINGIYNNDTEYVDITPELSYESLDRLWDHLKNIGPFKISRYGLRASSIESLLAGDFKVIEINMFLPMPLVLLTTHTTTATKLNFIISSMWLLAKATKTIPQNQKKKCIFFKNLSFHQRVKNLDRKEILR